MFIKKIVCVSLLFVTYCAYGDALSVGLIISKTQENSQPQCTEQEAQERQPLFIQAEKHEQYFITTRAQCLTLAIAIQTKNLMRHGIMCCILFTN